MERKKNLKTSYSASLGRHNINNLDKRHHFAYKASVNSPRQVQHQDVMISESASPQIIALIKAADLVVNNDFALRQELIHSVMQIKFVGHFPLTPASH